MLSDDEIVYRHKDGRYFVEHEDSGTMCELLRKPLDVNEVAWVRENIKQHNIRPLILATGRPQR